MEVIYEVALYLAIWGFFATLFFAQLYADKNRGKGLKAYFGALLMFGVITLLIPLTMGVPASEAGLWKLALGHLTGLFLINVYYYRMSKIQEKKPCEICGSRENLDITILTTTDGVLTRVLCSDCDKREMEGLNCDE